MVINKCREILTPENIDKIAKAVIAMHKKEMDLIPLIIASVFAVFFWSDVLYLSLMFIISNILAYIPVYIFVLKHDKTALAYFNEGVLSIFTKDGN